MLMLAGLLGLLAVGGAALAVDLSPELEEDGDDSVQPDGEDLATGEAADDIVPIDQIISGADGAEQISGDAGNDQINGYSGDDAIHGGAGNDTLHGATGDDALFGGDGNDTLHGEDGQDMLSGDSGADMLFGHGGADLMLGGDGEDTLQGGDGADSLRGGDGDDALHGGLGDDTLVGGQGQDTLFGGFGDDLLVGSEADQDDDEIKDYLNGGQGDDLLVAGRGDVMTGGDGADQFVLDAGETGNRDDASDPGSIRLMDFDAEEDQLLVMSDLEQNPAPQIEVIADEDTPGLSHILIDGNEVASVMGGATLTAEDIVVMDHAAGAALGLGSA
ncbi:calcium-binding protein [Sedimentitalea todarodis]|uniref:Calcium-binding protein n=1 Tax=Sedimentitalea todarodis TaxID=1631240 RepID=A0ABU3VA53_9RHOB|nr:calcium-binding protein [Sedimentitalea todarodis]MDU9003049.1 calcium-binding protein [Sedimentitalea todarodis]